MIAPAAAGSRRRLLHPCRSGRQRNLANRCRYVTVADGREQPLGTLAAPGRDGATCRAARRGEAGVGPTRDPRYAEHRPSDTPSTAAARPAFSGRCAGAGRRGTIRKDDAPRRRGRLTSWHHVPMCPDTALLRSRVSPGRKAATVARDLCGCGRSRSTSARRSGRGSHPPHRVGPRRALRERQPVAHQHRQRLLRRPAVRPWHLARLRRRQVRQQRSPRLARPADPGRASRAQAPGRGRLAGLRPPRPA